MPILYIHAGTSKTGTTSLQSFLEQNRDTLAKSHNLLYPKTGLFPPGNHVALFPIKQPLWAELKKEISAHKNHDVVLSSEGIAARNFNDLLPPSSGILKNTFEGYDIKLIVYIRRIDDHCKSRFLSMLKRGASPTSSYAEFFDYAYNRHQDLLFLSKHLKRLFEYIDKRNVSLRIYDKKMLKNGDIIADFFDFIRKEIPENPFPAQHTNPSLPAEAAPFMSNAFLPLPGDDPCWRAIVNSLFKIYFFPKGTGVGNKYLLELEEEVDKIDEYVPGYKELFAERPLSFSFPEVDVKNPQLLFITSLLYKLLIAQHGNARVTPQNDAKAQLKSVLSSRSWRYTAPLRQIMSLLRRLKRN